MSNKKLQVFVSSTFEDLKEERQAAVEAILSAGHIPAGMELFTAGDETQMTVIKRWIDESDVYLLILGGRYGSVEKVSGKSYTQLEYEYAVEKGKALFAVVIKDEALQKKVSLHGLKMIEQENSKEFNLFKDEVKSGKVVKFWSDAKDIQLAIFQTLSVFSLRKELVGWMRGDNTINTGIIAEELARLGKENEELRGKLAKSDIGYLYAGLTYEELKQLLQNENDPTNNFLPNDLYSFFIKNGKYLGVSFSNYKLLERLELEYNDINSEKIKLLIQSLAAYGLIDSYSPGVFKISDNGNRFYIKSLALQNEKDKNQNLSS